MEAVEIKLELIQKITIFKSIPIRKLQHAIFATRFYEVKELNYHYLEGKILRPKDIRGLVAWKILTRFFLFFYAHRTH